MEETSLVITPETQQAALAMEEQVKSLKHGIQGRYLELGRLLKEMRDNQYYKVLGFNTESEWLSSPDISIARSWASSAITVYDLYVVKLGKTPEELQGIDYTKLASIAPTVKKHPEDAQEWIDKASLLRRIDLQSELKVKKISDRVEKMEELQQIQVVENIIHGDALEEIKKLENHSVDAVITAPPVETPQFVIQDLLSEVRRVLRPNGSILIFTDYHNLLNICNAFYLNDIHLSRDIVVTYNTAIHETGVNSLLPIHELVLWGYVGDKPLYNFTEVERDVWGRGNPVSSEYANEKRSDILLSLIEMVTDKGQTVLDPFAGNGATIAAAKTLERNFIGIEKDELWYKLMLEKVSQV
jgi:tRNA1(Val) A37 N6-methylase TrmN6